LYYRESRTWETIAAEGDKIRDALHDYWNNLMK
jgi:hypothetical protein